MADLRITNSNVTTILAVPYFMLSTDSDSLPEKPESQTASIYLDRRCMNDPDPSIKKGQVD